MGKDTSPEYARISKLVEKLNMLDIGEHNKRAQDVGATEFIFSSTDVRDFYRVGIEIEIEEDS